MNLVRIVFAITTFQLLDSAAAQTIRTYPIGTDVPSFFHGPLARPFEILAVDATPLRLACAQSYVKLLLREAALAGAIESVPYADSFSLVASTATQLSFSIRLASNSGYTIVIPNAMTARRGVESRSRFVDCQLVPSDLTPRHVFAGSVWDWRVRELFRAEFLTADQSFKN